MAGGYNDLRKLSHDIERKKKAAQDQQKKATQEHRAALSSQMQEGKKEREAKAEKIAATTHLVRNLIIICFVGGIAIGIALFIKSISREEGPKKITALLDEEAKTLNATNEEYLTANSFVKKVIAACQENNDEQILWSPAVPASMKDRSKVKLNELEAGKWKISQINYNETLGFFNVTCTSDENETVYLRLTEGKGYKIELVKAY